MQIIEYQGISKDKTELLIMQEGERKLQRADGHTKYEMIDCQPLEMMRYKCLFLIILHIPSIPSHSPFACLLD
jgi:hypothetical protein